MTIITLRDYQTAAVMACYDHLRTRDDNPCIVIPTAGGKTPIMATICRDAVTQWDGRVLVLAHVKELLEQAADKLHIMAPDLWNKIGVYSAGLGSRDTDHPIIIAGIQSVYRRAAELGPFDLILIDEAHMIPPDGEGMYRTFIEAAKEVNPNVRIIGLTATPYRMSSGMICGPENILHHVCYEVGVKELIARGYLCPLRAKGGKQKADTSGLHLRGGEFIAGELESLMDDDGLVLSAVAEIIQQAQERKAVLIFASGVKHAEHIQRTIEAAGHECRLVCGNTPTDERADTLEAFKGGRLKYLVNVNVLTTGFDAPNTDCVAMVRPTMSPGLYYQMVGRGFRLCDGKADCLVLDFGGNILRHGPVDCLDIQDRRAGSGNGEAPAKECPQCQELIHAGYAKCPECGYEFPPPEKGQHDGEATNEAPLSGVVTDETYEVQSIEYRVHVKRGAGPDDPRTMRVDYEVGWNQWQSEWICLEHDGYARGKAERWWHERSDDPCPTNVDEAVELAEFQLAKASRITVRSVSGEKYDRIIGYELGPKPTPLVGDLAQGEPEYLPADDDIIPF